MLAAYSSSLLSSPLGKLCLSIAFAATMRVSFANVVKISLMLDWRSVEVMNWSFMAPWNVEDILNANVSVGVRAPSCDLT